MVRAVNMTDLSSRKLGLKRGTVTLAEYTHQWREAFCEERALLADALALVPCQIEHIGSTSVPGLKAKPLLDIAVGIKGSYPLTDCIPIIESIGYTYRGEDDEIGYMFVRGPQDNRTHYLHVVRLGDSNWDRWLMFRDYLRANPDARQTYESEKTRLATLFEEDRDSYTSGKSRVIGDLLSKAKDVRNSSSDEIR